jgi:hypothetical protein
MHEQTRIKNDFERIVQYRKRPLLWIKDIFGLVPQPLKPNVPDHYPYEFYRPEHFEPFIKGEHITWQQWLIVRAVEWAVNGKASRWISVASGHGIGKSAIESMLILWFLGCWRCKIACTAPSADQMFDILWAEISLWLPKMKEEVRANYIWQKDHVRMADDPHNWWARARTARPDKPEALAGIHAENVGIFVDEASGVEEIVFKTAHGALTNKNILILMISNPTRSIGYFFDSHHKDKKDWQCMQFSSLESPIVDESFITLIREKYGEGSDEWRIRVTGKFPREDAVDDKGYVQLVPEADMRFTDDDRLFGDKRMGVDPSGMGSNKTVYVIRDGMKAYVAAAKPKTTPEQVAMQTATLMDDMAISADKVWLDIFGVGADSYQKLALMRLDVNGINVDEDPDDLETYINKRAEAYWRMRKWLRQGGELVRHDGWEDIKTVKYRRNLKGKIQIMPKVDMQKLGLPSPDFADALMLTFIEDEIQNGQYQDEDTSYPFDNVGR